MKRSQIASAAKRKLVSEQNAPNPGPYFIPGYGDVAPTKGAIKVAKAQAQYDGVSNRTVDRSNPGGRQRAPLRLKKRKRPQVN